MIKELASSVYSAWAISGFLWDAFIFSVEYTLWVSLMVTIFRTCFRLWEWMYYTLIVWCAIFVVQLYVNLTYYDFMDDPIQIALTQKKTLEDGSEVEEKLGPLMSSYYRLTNILSMAVWIMTDTFISSVKTTLWFGMTFFVYNLVTLLWSYLYSAIFSFVGLLAGYCFFAWLFPSLFNTEDCDQ